VPDYPEDREESRSGPLYKGRRFIDPDEEGKTDRQVMILTTNGYVPLLRLLPGQVRALRDAGRISQKDLDAWREHQLRR